MAPISDEAQRSRWRRIFALVEVPEFKPITGWVAAGRDGTVWVASGNPRDPSPDPVRWKVIGPDGALLGDIQMPPGFLPLDIGADYVLGEWLDEFDVPFVHLYELIK